MFAEQIVQDNNKENTKTPHYRVGNPLTTVDSDHKGPVIRNAFTCHDVFMKNWI